MTGSHRTSRIGKVLAAVVLFGLAGCQQVPSRPAAPAPLGLGSEPRGGGTTITPAQEADVQISMGRAAEQQGDFDQAIAATLPATFLPVVVERASAAPGPNQSRRSALLDQSRRSALVALLGQGSFPVPPERVVIGPRIANGMTGVESTLIYGRQLSNLSSGGSGGSAGAGAASGLDGGGLSGSAVSGGVR